MFFAKFVGFFCFCSLSVPRRTQTVEDFLPDSENEDDSNDIDSKSELSDGEEHEDIDVDNLDLAV